MCRKGRASLTLSCRVCQATFHTKPSRTRPCCTRACGYIWRNRLQSGPSQKAAKKCLYCPKMMMLGPGYTRTYCSAPCRVSHKKSIRPPLVCLQCGKVNSTKHRKRGKFCNSACGYAYMKAATLDRRPAAKCNYCGIVFLMSDAQIQKAAKRRYCSPECYRLGRMRPLSPCLTCGKMRRLKKTRGNPRAGLYCSKNCSATAPTPYTTASPWPVGLGRAKVRLLNLLAADGGALPLREVSARLKLSLNGAEDGLRHLVQLELVARFPLANSFHRARMTYIYSLGPAALDILKEKAKCQPKSESKS
jgi:hypothetical protein